MAQTRIKGQDVEVQLVVNGELKTNITAVRSFEITFENDTMSEGYLGETVERKDAIFKGISGKIEFHMENKELLDLFGTILDNNRGRSTAVKININARLNFPNGQRPQVLISNVEFGSLPLNFSSRSDYVTTSLDFVASEFEIIN
jgi:hypothetical protein